MISCSEKYYEEIQQDKKLRNGEVGERKVKLGRMTGKGLLRATSEQKLEQSDGMGHVDMKRKEFLGRASSGCKGSEAATTWAYLRNIKKASAAEQNAGK